MERWVTVNGTPLSRGTAPAYVERLARWAYGRGESDIYALQAVGEIEARNALTIAYLTLLIAVFRLGYDLGKDVDKRKEPPRKR